MKYRLLGPAMDDLENIDAWVTSKFGEDVALKVRLELFETFETIAQQQFIGVTKPEMALPPVRFSF